MSRRAFDRQLDSLRADVVSLEEMVVERLEDAIEAYAEPADARRCHEIDDRDTELDAMCAHAGEVITRALLEHDVTDAGDIEGLVGDVTTLMLVVRDLERVGDHAVNIAARTLYTIESDDSLLEYPLRLDLLDVFYRGRSLRHMSKKLSPAVTLTREQTEQRRLAAARELLEGEKSQAQLAEDRGVTPSAVSK